MIASNQLKKTGGAVQRREVSSTLADCPYETLLVQCDQCPAIRRHFRAALIERFGPDAALVEVLRALCRRRPGEPEHDPHLLGEHNEQD